MWWEKFHFDFDWNYLEFADCIRNDLPPFQEDGRELSIFEYKVQLGENESRKERKHFSLKQVLLGKGLSKAHISLSFTKTTRPTAARLVVWGGPLCFRSNGVSLLVKTLLFVWLQDMVILFVWLQDTVGKSVGLAWQMFNIQLFIYQTQI